MIKMKSSSTTRCNDYFFAGLQDAFTNFAEVKIRTADFAYFVAVCYGIVTGGAS